jgi:hypothetical protein
MANFQEALEWMEKGNITERSHGICYRIDDGVFEMNLPVDDKWERVCLSLSAIRGDWELVSVKKKTYAIP